MDAAGADFCTFDGTAARLHVRGEGRAVLVEPGPFKDGHAASVFLRGATIDPGLSNPKIAHPAAMAPVGMNPKGRAFDVTYSAGNPWIIDIALGAETGGYQGPLPGGAACPPEWCRIVWSGEAKHIELSRDSAEPIALAGWFPYGTDGGEGAVVASQLLVVEMWGASGELRCGDTAEHIEGQWLWTAGPTRALTLRGPDAEGPRRRLWTEGQAFRVHVENDARPIQAESAIARAGKPIGLLLVLALLAVLAAGLAWRRLRRSPGEDKALVQPEAGRSTPKAGPKEAVSARAGATDNRVRMFISFAPRDKVYLDKLEVALTPLVRDGRLRLFSSRDVRPGQKGAQVIADDLGEAQVILLLISIDSLASEACREERTRAIGRDERGEARVIPVYLRPCDVSGQPFAEIEGLPRTRDERGRPRPISTFESDDVAYTEIVEHVRGVIEELEKLRADHRSGPDGARAEGVVKAGS